MPQAQPGIMSVQLWSVRDAYFKDRADTLSRLARMGFKNVEPFGIGSPDQSAAERLKSVQELRNILDDLGMQAPSVHANAPYGPEAEAILDELDILGSKLSVISWPGVVHGFKPDDLNDRDRTVQLAEAVNEAAHNAAKRGIRQAYHNHAFEWGKHADGRYAYDVLLEQFDPSVQLEVDIYWAKVGGQDPAELLRRLGERVPAIHVKDGHQEVSETNPQTPLGEGLVDYAAAIQAAPSARLHVLEMDHSADIFHDLGVSTKKLLDEGLSVWQ